MQNICPKLQKRRKNLKHQNKKEQKRPKKLQKPRKKMLTNQLVDRLVPKQKVK